MKTWNQHSIYMWRRPLNDWPDYNCKRCFIWNQCHLFNFWEGLTPNVWLVSSHQCANIIRMGVDIDGMHSSVLPHVTPEIKFFSMLGNLDSKILFGQILLGTRINVVTAAAKLEMGEWRPHAPPISCTIGEYSTGLQGLEQPLNLCTKIYYTIFGIW